MDKVRNAVLQALLHVDESEGYSNLVLDKTLAAQEISGRDASFAAALFYGVLERRITLDYYLSKFSKLALTRLSPCVRELLRMGAYQLLYLDRVPDSAAVNEAVELARGNKEERACGFLNGVLRALERSKAALALPSGTDDDSLGICFSCPAWLVRLWREAYGKETALNLLQSLAEKPPLYARVNTTRINSDGLLETLKKENVKATAITNISDAVLLENTGSVAELSAFSEGLFHIQDLSSQLCCSLFNARPGERVIDVCAAPGGKTFTIAQHMENKGEVLAFDKYGGKARLITKGAERLGLSCITAAVRDAADAEASLVPGDRVLCDVPCSGLGIIRRKPEIRYKERRALDSLPDLQYLILYKTAALVKPDGVLFYSTCTLNPRENGLIARRFLRENPKFSQLPLILPPNFAHIVEEPENELTLMPHAHGTDGFFIAAFQNSF